MKITIYGRGFGLYGYLPALLTMGKSVILPKKYQATVLLRNDIAKYHDEIEWVDDHETCLKQCDGLIIATLPKEQEALMKACLQYPNITHYLLEKPLATTPANAFALQNLLKLSGKKFRIGYHFRHTEWGKACLSDLKNIDSITWTFKAHHYANDGQTWKRRHAEGGGALRFYGIHLIAFLSEMGYDKVVYSKISNRHPNEADTWEACFSGISVEDCHIMVASHDEKTTFEMITNKERTFFTTPFHSNNENQSTLDLRIPFLKEGLSDLFDNDISYHPWYEHAIDLWQKSEDAL